jgi:predicted CopG family antitoxin
MTKVVQLADDAYEALARQKRPGESFSDVVRRAFPRRPLTDLVEYFASWTPAERARARRIWKIGREIQEEEINRFYEDRQKRGK